MCAMMQKLRTRAWLYARSAICKSKPGRRSNPVRVSLQLCVVPRFKPRRPRLQPQANAAPSKSVVHRNKKQARKSNLIGEGKAARGAETSPGPMPENKIIPEEWEKVRRSQCLPGHCPRVVGDPPGPPKDKHCEVCASGFLDQYWENLLHGPGDAPPQRARRLGRLAERGRHTAGPLIVLPR